jgi:hypothetical protein
LTHGGDELHVDDRGEVTWFVEAVEATHLHELTHNLVSYLVAPLVDVRHVDIVDEHHHLFAARGTESAAHPLLHVTFYSFLLHDKQGKERKNLKLNGIC